MKRALPGLVWVLLAGLSGCGDDDSACQDLLALCTQCTAPEQVEICEARARDRDQVQCSLVIDDIRAACTDAGMQALPRGSGRDASVSTVEGGS